MLYLAYLKQRRKISVLFSITYIVLPLLFVTQVLVNKQC